MKASLDPNSISDRFRLSEPALQQVEDLSDQGLRKIKQHLLTYVNNMGFIPWNLTNNLEIEASWKVAENRVQPFGKNRFKRNKEYDQAYGKMAWRQAWKLGDGNYYSFLDTVKLYEHSYVELFRKRPDILNALIERASEVYDSNENNIDSGTNYLIQTGNSIHIQDIAVRRAIETLGKNFEGNRLVQIRSNSVDDIGKQLSPRRVPFCLPEIIDSPKMLGRWDENSVEQWYLGNRVIQVNPALQKIANVNLRYDVAFKSIDS